MKKTMLLAITLSAIFCSCESDGPKSRLYEDTRTSDEMFQDVITRVRDKDCVKNRVKRAKIVRFTLC